MNGEAADEVVRMVLNGSEVAIRLTGSAAKNLHPRESRCCLRLSWIRSLRMGRWMW